MSGPLFLRQVLAVLALLLAGLCPAVTWAQTAPSAPAPAFDNVDGNGVDVTTGKFRFAMSEGTIGSGPGAVSLARYWGDGVWRDNWSGGLYQIGSGATAITYVDFGGTSDSFRLVSGAYESREGNGATLTFDSGTQSYVFISSSGTRIDFQTQLAGKIVSGYICPTGATICARPMDVIQPTGLRFDLQWGEAEKCTGPVTDCSSKFYYRFQGVTSNAGYGLTIGYQTDDPGTISTPAQPPATWYTRVGVTFFNGASACGTTCPRMTYSTSAPLTLTDALGRVWRFTMTGANLTGIKRPGSASADTTTISYDGAAHVTQVVRDGVTTGYAYTVSGATATMVATDMNGGHLTTLTDVAVGRPKQVTDPLSRVTQQTYDLSTRPKQTTFPETNARVLDYDARGNVTTVTLKAKTGSGLGDIVASALFPTSCASPITAATCNKPISSTDPRGNVTSYFYLSNGQLDHVTSPPVGGVSPQTRYGYTGVGGVSMPTSVAACRTTASCAGGADEVKTAITYNSNLLPSSVTTGAGDNSLTATVATTYTPAGDATSVDGPLPGAADTSHAWYDADRELTLAVGPDPDGSTLPLKNRATRNTYNDDGQITAVAQGTANADGTGFVALQQALRTYDANGRLSTAGDANAAGTLQTLSQYSYDLLGRPDCTAQRMNSALWPPAVDACTLQTPGSFGSDRIVKTTYDAASEPVTTTSAFGTADAATDATLAYTDNGLVKSLTDANGYLTRYFYDGFDRPAELHYPLPATPGAYSTTDYEAWPLYDAAGNVTRQRLRDGTTIDFTYDALNRRTFMDLAAGGINDDVTYSYDLFGRLLSATGGSGHHEDLTYDALGRVVNEYNTVPYPGIAFDYDLAGRRTKMTWYDGLYLVYDRLVTGETSAIRENGATSGAGVLATYGYDDLGRRTGIARGNGTSTAYQYDAISRLASLAHHFATSSNDVAWSYAYNPASQLASSTRDNNAYAFPLASQDTAETPNGLNQLTAQGGTSYGYDARGNLNTVGAATPYVYSQLNYQFSVPNGYAMYDPVGRRDYVYQTGVPTRWIGYEGARLSIEFAPSTPARRFAWGPGQDELLVQYEGAGTSDRRWYYADERGSTVAVADASGNPTHKLAYDDYGNASVTGTNPDLVRMRYTGQEWQAELGLYNYKSRLYAPGIGRFLQTDPIGTAGGVNLYAYVGGDPVNGTDPFGLTSHGTYDCTGSLACPNDGGGGNSGGSGCASTSCFGTGADLFGGEGGGGLSCGATPAPAQGTNELIIVTATRCSPDVDSLRNVLLRPRTYGTGEIGNRGTRQEVAVDSSCSGVPAAYDASVQAKALEARRLAFTAQDRIPDGPSFREYGFTGRPFHFHFFFGQGFVTSDIKQGYSQNVRLDRGYFDTFSVHVHSGTTGPSERDIPNTPHGFTQIVIGKDAVFRCYTAK